jgi:hypothetical protein
VERHVVERGYSEDDARVAWDTSDCAESGARRKLTDQVGDEEEDVLLGLVFGGTGRLHSCAVAVGAAVGAVAYG